MARSFPARIRPCQRDTISRFAADMNSFCSFLLYLFLTGRIISSEANLNSALPPRHGSEVNSNWITLLGRRSITSSAINAALSSMGAVRGSDLSQKGNGDGYGGVSLFFDVSE
jgi:hypothetical protein